MLASEFQWKCWRQFSLQLCGKLLRLDLKQISNQEDTKDGLTTACYQAGNQFSLLHTHKNGSAMAVPEAINYPELPSHLPKEYDICGFFNIKGSLIMQGADFYNTGKNMPNSIKIWMHGWITLLVSKVK